MATVTRPRRHRRGTRRSLQPVVGLAFVALAMGAGWTGPALPGGVLPAPLRAVASVELRAAVPLDVMTEGGAVGVTDLVPVTRAGTTPRTTADAAAGRAGSAMATRAGAAAVAPVLAVAVPAPADPVAARPVRPVAATVRSTAAERAPPR
jgi:hypothetical protein